MKDRKYYKDLSDPYTITRPAPSLPWSYENRLWSWWFLSVATDPIYTIGLKYVIPTILGQIARPFGHLPNSLSSKCHQTKNPCFLSITKILGLKNRGFTMSTSSFVLYITSIGRILSIVLFLVIGPLADFGSWRKRILFILTISGSVAAILSGIQVYFCSFSNHNICSLTTNSLNFILFLLIITYIKIAHSGISVLKHSLLPHLVNTHPSLNRCLARSNNYQDSAQSCNDLPQLPPNQHYDSINKPLLPHKQDILSKKHQTRTLLQIDDLNTQEWGITARSALIKKLYSSLSFNSSMLGYSASLIIVLPVLMLDMTALNTSFLFKGGLLMTLFGIWWLLFSLPSLCVPITNPPPPLPYGASPFTYGMFKLYAILKQSRKLPFLALYYPCSVCISAAYVMATSGLITPANPQFNIDFTTLIASFAITPATALLGTLCFNRLQRNIILPTTLYISIILVLFVLGPLDGSLGLLHLCFGLNPNWTYFVTSAWYSFLGGALTSTDKVLLTELVPSIAFSEFYALFGIFSRLGASIGTFLLACLSDLLNDFRNAQLFIALLFILPIPILSLIMDMKKAREDIHRFTDNNKEYLHTDPIYPTQPFQASL